MRAPSSANGKAIAIAIVTFVLVLLGLAVPVFFVTLLLAGPHSDLLPGFLQPVALLAGWAALGGIPTWLAIRGYRWQRRRANMRRAA